MKLSKPKIKLHKEAEKLLEKEVLSWEDKWFVMENWFPAYNNQIGEIASFFTPVELATDFTLQVHGKRVLDLCAGIGILGFQYLHRCKDWDKVDIDLVCIERNEEFVRVGRKILPEATWICADVFDENIYKELGKFDFAISNPPFGNISTDTDTGWLRYKGAVAEYRVLDIAEMLAPDGAFIISQGSSPFRYSGRRDGVKKQLSDKYRKFYNETGIVLNMNIGIDCDYHIDKWKGAAPKVEIVTIRGYAPDRADWFANEQPEPVKEEIIETIQELSPKHSQVQYNDSFRNILGDKPDVYTPEERKARWIEWKKLALERGDEEVVKYWCNVQECRGCVHLNEAESWCHWSELPATVNPILTYSTGMIGMACMGLGLTPLEPEQLTLF